MCTDVSSHRQHVTNGAIGSSFILASCLSTRVPLTLLIMSIRHQQRKSDKATRITQTLCRSRSWILKY